MSDYDTGDTRLDEIFTRLDALERQVDRLIEAIAGLSEVTGKLLRMQ